MKTIGMWNKVINFLGYLGVFYNIFMYMLPGLGLEKKDWIYTTSFSALLVFVKYCLEQIIGHESSWLKKEKWMEKRLQGMEESAGAEGVLG